MIRLHEELVVDNFAGGGGASLGIEWALGRSPDVAANHDPEAVAMHQANHPTTRHLCGNVWDVDPRGVCGARRVALAWFSPDCTFHSKARGSKPFRDPKEARGRRGLAWVVVRWAKAVRPRVIILENVEEFADWGPLGDDGRPDPARRGLTFRRWWGQLQAAGYVVEMRELRACDYGAPTSRRRRVPLPASRAPGVPRHRRRPPRPPRDGHGPPPAPGDAAPMISVLVPESRALLARVRPTSPLFANAMIAEAFAAAHTRGRLTVLPTTDGGFVLFDRDAPMNRGVRGRFPDVKAAHAALEAA